VKEKLELKKNKLSKDGKKRLDNLYVEFRIESILLELSKKLTKTSLFWIDSEEVRSAEVGRQAGAVRSLARKIHLQNRIWRKA